MFCAVWLMVSDPVHTPFTSVTLFGVEGMFRGRGMKGTVSPVFCTPLFASLVPVVQLVAVFASEEPVRVLTFVLKPELVPLPVHCVVGTVRFV